jgi:response regulator RpfG family c-di-GMP phosphodiesterase
MKNNLRFILIDDDDIFNFLHQAVIKEVIPHAEVLAFQSSKGAMDFVKSDKVSETIFLIDIRMPELNGFDLIHSIQELPEESIRGSRFYFLTSSLDDRDRARGLSFDIVSGYLEKPISIEKIRELTGF